jgi:hypothetical protein
MIGRPARRALLSAAALLLVSPTSSRAQAALPPWQQRLMPWETHAGQPRPWRDDARLAGKSEPGYPDDFPVYFANPDSAHGGLHEIMWVRVTAYDAASDLFLGILLNQPDYLKELRAGDNVVFRAVPGLTAPATAVGGPAYAEAGWPASREPAFFATLRDGIRAYRNGNEGHNMPEIERCIRVLAPAVAAMPAGASRDERFVANYVLGRCRAEKYATLDAISNFRAAIAIDSTDYDAHMALLAELSLMTHRLPRETSAAERERWDREFVDELTIVRSRFMASDGVAQILVMVFDPAHEAELAPEWKPEVERLRRVGYAVFRWKHR